MADQNLDIRVRVIDGKASAVQVNEVATATGNVGKQAEETTKKTSRLSSTMKSLATGFAVYKGAQFIKSAVNETTSLAKATSGLQRITTLDTQSAAGWVAVAKERGVQSKQLNQAFISMSKGIQSAADGSKAGKAAFAQLGLDAANLKVQDTRTQLGMIADSFKALPGGVDKAALAQKLFGRQAQAMLPLINGGAQALNKQVEEMGKMTGETDRSKKAGLDLVKQQRALNASMMGVKVAIGTALIPILSAASKAIAPIAQGFAQMMQHSEAFRIAVYAVTAAIGAWIIAAKLLALSGLEVNAAWALLPALIIGIGVALVALYMKCAWFRNAVNAVWHVIRDGAVAAFNVIKAVGAVMLAPAIAEVKVFVAVVKAGISVAKAVIGALPGVIRGITGAVTAVAGVVKNVFAAAWNAVKTAIDGVVSGINAVVNTAKKITSLPGKAFKFVTSHLAEGGTVGPGGTTALVGERGPEIVTLPGGAHVTPNHQLGLAGGSAVIHTHVHLNDYEIAHAIGNYVAGQQAAR